jgi:hypothetical protein
MSTQYFKITGLTGNNAAAVDVNSSAGDAGLLTQQTNKNRAKSQSAAR